MEIRASPPVVIGIVIKTHSMKGFDDINGVHQNSNKFFSHLSPNLLHLHCNPFGHLQTKNPRKIEARANWRRNPRARPPPPPSHHWPSLHGCHLPTIPAEKKNCKNHDSKKSTHCSFKIFKVSPP